MRITRAARSSIRAAEGRRRVAVGRAGAGDQQLGRADAGHDAGDQRVERLDGDDDPGRGLGGEGEAGQDEQGEQRAQQGRGTHGDSLGNKPGWLDK